MNALIVSVALVITSFPCAGFAQAVNSDELLEKLDRIGRRVTEEACRAPVKVVAKVVPNPHDSDVRDEVRRVTCVGQESETYVAHAFDPPHTLPVSLTIRVPRPFLPEKLQVGAGRAEVVETLGTPDQVGRDWLSYVLPSEAGNDRITFKTRNGKVTTILWSWDVD